MRRVTASMSNSCARPSTPTASSVSRTFSKTGLHGHMHGSLGTWEPLMC